jgi:hypothetical protein
MVNKLKPAIFFIALSGALAITSHTPASAQIEARLLDPSDTITHRFADPDCRWTRLEVPMDEGLQWEAEEDRESN